MWRLGIFSIVLFALFLRFCNYESRWGIAHDQASFAITARHAVETHKLPLLGPFSSALTRVISLIENIMLGVHFAYFFSGFRVYSKRTLETLQYKNFFNDYVFD